MRELDCIEDSSTRWTLRRAARSSSGTTVARSLFFGAVYRSSKSKPNIQCTGRQRAGQLVACSQGGLREEPAALRCEMRPGAVFDDRRTDSAPDSSRLR